MEKKAIQSIINIKIFVIKQNIFNESKPAFNAGYYCFLLHTAVMQHKIYKMPSVKNGQNKRFIA